MLTDATAAAIPTVRRDTAPAGDRFVGAARPPGPGRRPASRCSQPTASWLAAMANATATTPAADRPVIDGQQSQRHAVTAAPGSGWLALSSPVARRRVDMRARASVVVARASVSRLMTCRSCPPPVRGPRRRTAAARERATIPVSTTTWPSEWWRPDGAFAMLHWLARGPGRLVPPATRRDALLVDVGCGGGLLAPQPGRHGLPARRRRPRAVRLLEQAAGARDGRGSGRRERAAAGRRLRRRGRSPARSSSTCTDLPGTVAELCRVLRPGGAAGARHRQRHGAAPARHGDRRRAARRRPGGGIHDPHLFVTAASGYDRVCARARRRRCGCAGSVRP